MEINEAVLIRKGGDYGTKITLKENGKLISDEQSIASIFNDQYVNIIEKTTGSAPASIVNDGLDKQNITVTINKIIDKFKNHKSIKAIQENNSDIEPYSIPLAQTSDIREILKNIDVKTLE